ncbi:transporter substrate-binding domain-containing protein [Chitinimonas viridis]|uniref:Transporter substrate-binding domain-containing protein n=1 Tax=Chitinimonas viridis TaxID=664880 RepID=A0ABT8B8D3_9NEIS|nr:transporter substrate-binding domain-containing protein [Chitinimonas viridis]MDN3578030.1 transporter substrate-binding domain-containing protein [Chitinimonas viridis]
MVTFRHCLLLILAAPAMAEEVLNAYNTYLSQPFVLDKGGLAADVVTYLNSKLKGRYQFALQTMPRERLNTTVIHQPDFKGIVLFMSPRFVGDINKTRYRWSIPLMEDANAVLSHPARKVEYTGPDSLKGKLFAGVLGHRYVDLDDRFGKDIQREDVASELANLHKVAARRCDVTITPQTIYRYLVNQHGLQNRLYVSARPHISFSRHILAARHEDKMVAALDEVLLASKADPAWQTILAKYSIQ